MLYDTDMGALEGLACVASGDLDKDAVTTGMTSEVQQLITDPLREFKIWNMVRASSPSRDPLRFSRSSPTLLAGSKSGTRYALLPCHVILCEVKIWNVMRASPLSRDCVSLPALRLLPFVPKPYYSPGSKPANPLTYMTRLTMPPTSC